MVVTLPDRISESDSNGRGPLGGSVGGTNPETIRGAHSCSYFTFIPSDSGSPLASPHTLLVVRQGTHTKKTVYRPSVVGVQVAVRMNPEDAYWYVATPDETDDRERVYVPETISPECQFATYPVQ